MDCKPEPTNVVAFSGGRTSAYMLHRLLQQHGDELRQNWKVLFCNTGKEFDETLEFVHQVETRWDVPVVWLEYCRVPASEEIAGIYQHPRAKKTVREQAEDGLATHWFRVVDYQTAFRNNASGTGSPFDDLLGWANVLPNVRARFCTVQLKVRTMQRYLFSLGIYSWRDHIGIRADEWERTLTIRKNAPGYTEPTFPLHALGVDVNEVNEFWRNSEFDLQLESWKGNCDGCFLKATGKRRRLAKEFPNNFAWWEQWESVFAEKADGDGSTFRKGQKCSVVRVDAMQPTLFDEDDEVPCGCTDGGYEYDDDEGEMAA